MAVQVQPSKKVTISGRVGQDVAGRPYPATTETAVKVSGPSAVTFGETATHSLLGTTIAAT